MVANVWSPTDADRRTRPAARAGATVEARWTVRLLGAIDATAAGQTLTRWPTRATAALLARLALEPDRAHSREELIELLWPGVPLAAGRNRLRQSLSTLKNLLEPASQSSVPVLQADRLSIRLLPGVIDCDARRFERLARAGDTAQARKLYRGELMPGYYEDWVVEERRRLQGLYEQLDVVAAPAPGQANATGPAGPHATPAAAPAPSPEAVAPVPTGLPSYWTRAFGAELTASRLLALVCSQRLVTVHGPGGSGKTRLAVEVAQALRDGRSWSMDTDGSAPPLDRIAFVPLVDCVDAAQALDAICSSLHADALGDPRASIVAALAGRRTLLLLDNVEQCVDAIGDEVVRLLAGVPALHILVTSRRLLEVDGEHAFELEGLALPAADAAPAGAVASPAVALFVDRARAARGDFRLGVRNAGAIVDLVRLLSGMPLAIELAASRVRGLAPQELLQRLSEAAGTPMLDLLARGAQRASSVTRHASMRHVVDWSWRQLTPVQAQLLQAMSVFAASAQLATVAAVSGIDMPQAQARLDELRDASLVRAVQDRDLATRYALLQPVREFAAERMAPADAREARARLRLWLIGYARHAVAQGPAAIAPELAHVHAAIASASADGAPQQALELSIALRSYWNSDDLSLSALIALEGALAETPTADAEMRCDAHELLSFGRGLAGCAPEAIAHAEAAVAAASDDRRRSLALARWVWSLYLAGRFDIPKLESALSEAAALAQRSGDVFAQATVLRMQSLVVCNLKLDYAGAEVLSARTRALWERLGNRQMAYLSLLNQAMMWGKMGRGNEEAITVMGECERAARADGDWTGLIVATRQLGRVHVRMRHWDAAAAAFRRSVSVAWQRHAAQGLAQGLLHLPLAMVMCGQGAEAARLYGFATAHWWHLFPGLNQIEARELRCARLLLHMCLGGARADALRTLGRGLNLAEAVALALEGG